MADTRKKSAALAQIDAVMQKGKKKKGGGGKKGGGSRKIGRYSSSASSMRYKNERRWEKNKLKRVKRHFKYHPNDNQARNWLNRSAA